MGIVNIVKNILTFAYVTPIEQTTAILCSRWAFLASKSEDIKDMFFFGSLAAASETVAVIRYHWSYKKLNNSFEEQGFDESLVKKYLNTPWGAHIAKIVAKKHGCRDRLDEIINPPSQKTEMESLENIACKEGDKIQNLRTGEVGTVKYPDYTSDSNRYIKAFLEKRTRRIRRILRRPVDAVGKGFRENWPIIREDIKKYWKYAAVSVAASAALCISLKYAQDYLINPYIKSDTIHLVNPEEQEQKLISGSTLEKILYSSEGTYITEDGCFDPKEGIVYKLNIQRSYISNDITVIDKEPYYIPGRAKIEEIVEQGYFRLEKGFYDPKSNVLFDSDGMFVRIAEEDDLRFIRSFNPLNKGGYKPMLGKDIAEVFHKKQE
ncbi:hypothetical protein GOV06_02070 [Candidatus Woesearchaeota archaeon]|nr:hypothetical protein [Candidatus Woesearchaeota archaeon]